jgi:hypothetical protein
MGCFGTIGRLGRGALSALALALALHASAQAAEPSGGGLIVGEAQLFQQFPGRFALAHDGPRDGVQVRLDNGSWLTFTDNMFSKTAPPTMCWYAPKLSVAGVCMSGEDVSLTILVDMKTGHRLSAPGLAGLTPDPRLISVGPGGPHNGDTDSITLIRVAADGLVEEGGALFDDGYRPGDWKSARCYRLAPPAGRAAMWLERSADGAWKTTPAPQSACQGRHAR